MQWTAPTRRHLGAKMTAAKLQSHCLLVLSDGPLLAMCGRPRIGKGCFDGGAIWSGAAMCSACLRDTMIAGPNAIRGSGPNYKHELRGPLAKTGFPNPRWSTGFALPHIHPANKVAPESGPSSGLQGMDVPLRV